MCKRSICRLLRQRGGFYVSPQRGASGQAKKSPPKRAAVQHRSFNLCHQKRPVAVQIVDI